MNNPMSTSLLTLPTGIRLSYQGNILYCSSKRTAEENFSTARKALCILLDISEEALFGKVNGNPTFFEQDGGKIEAYRTHG